MSKNKKNPAAMKALRAENSALYQMIDDVVRRADWEVGDQERHVRELREDYLDLGRVSLIGAGKGQTKLNEELRALIEPMIVMVIEGEEWEVGDIQRAVFALRDEWNRKYAQVAV